MRSSGYLVSAATRRIHRDWITRCLLTRSARRADAPPMAPTSLAGTGGLAPTRSPAVSTRTLSNAGAGAPASSAVRKVRRAPSTWRTGRTRSAPERRSSPAPRVRRIETNSRGLVEAAIWLDNTGAQHRQRAQVIVLCANGVGTPRLLLLSDSPSHPQGLANSSGLVGRNLMPHPNRSVVGLDGEDLQSHRGLAGQPFTACSL